MPETLYGIGEEIKGGKAVDGPLGCARGRLWSTAKGKESTVPSATLGAGSGRWQKTKSRAHPRARLPHAQPHWPEPWQARMGEAHKFGSAFMPSGPMQVWVYMHQKL